MEEIDFAIPSRAVALTWTESSYSHEIDENLSFFPELSKLGKKEQTQLDSLVDSHLNILIVTLNSGEVAGYGYGQGFENNRNYPVVFSKKKVRDSPGEFHGLIVLLAVFSKFLQNITVRGSLL